MNAFNQCALAGAIFSLKLAQGMKVAPKDFAFRKRTRRGLIRPLLVAIFVPPCVTLCTVLWMHLPRSTTVGLALAAVSPAPPLLISSAMAAGSRAAFAVKLQRLLSLLAALTTPLLLKVLASLLGFHALISPWAVLRQLALALLIPTCLGMLARAWKPEASARWAPRLATLGGHVYIVVGCVLVAESLPMLRTFGFRSYAAVLIITGAALALGHMLGPSHSGDRSALALTCASRNTGLAMLIASLNFPTNAATTHLVPYVAVTTLCTNLYTHLRSRAQKGTSNGAVSALRLSWSPGGAGRSRLCGSR